MANLKRRGRYFSVQWRWHGKQYIKPLRLEDEDEATRVMRKVEAAIDGLKRGRHPKASLLLDEGYDIRDLIFPNEKTAHLLDGEVKVDDGNPLKVSELADDYDRHLAINESDGHRRRVKSKLRHLTEFTDDARVSTLDRQAIDKYVGHRRKGSMKAQTVKNELAAIRAMLNWAVETGRLDRRPIDKFPTIKTAGSDPFLFKDDIDEIIANGNLTKKMLRELGRRMVLAPKDIDRLIQRAESKLSDLVLPLKLVATTGIRRSELVRLGKSDFDPKACRLTVRSGKGSRKKSGTIRIIDIHKSVLGDLRQHHRSLPKKAKWLFPIFDPTKNRNADRSVEDRRADRASDLLSDILDGSEFDLLSGWHSLRHGFITTCVWQGITFDQVSQWTGHVDPETQRRYTHYSGAVSKQLMAALPFTFSVGGSHGRR